MNDLEDLTLFTYDGIFGIMTIHFNERIFKYYAHLDLAFHYHFIMSNNLNNQLIKSLKKNFNFLFIKYNYSVLYFKSIIFFLSNFTLY